MCEPRPSLAVRYGAGRIRWQEVGALNTSAELLRRKNDGSISHAALTSVLPSSFERRARVSLIPNWAHDRDLKGSSECPLPVAAIDVGKSETGWEDAIGTGAHVTPAFLL
jgi:hypothetical protein